MTDSRYDPRTRDGSGVRYGGVERDSGRAASVPNGAVPRFSATTAPPPTEDAHGRLHLSLGNAGSQPIETRPNAPAAAPGPQRSPDGPARPPHPQYGTPNGAPAQTERDGGRPREGGSFIDQTLRARVDGDIAAFLAAFDIALAGDSQESRAGLREATDRLLRAGARTRIELERLEARVPLPARDPIARQDPAWRHR